VGECPGARNPVLQAFLASGGGDADTIRDELGNVMWRPLAASPGGAGPVRSHCGTAVSATGGLLGGAASGLLGDPERLGGPRGAGGAAPAEAGGFCGASSDEVSLLPQRLSTASSIATARRGAAGEEA
jgi:hypothetical protein